MVRLLTVFLIASISAAILARVVVVEVSSAWCRAFCTSSRYCMKACLAGIQLPSMEQACSHLVVT